MRIKEHEIAWIRQLSNAHIVDDNWILGKCENCAVGHSAAIHEDYADLCKDPCRPRAFQHQVPCRYAANILPIAGHPGDALTYLLVLQQD